MRRPKGDAHAQVKARCACAGQSEMRMRRSKRDAHAQTKMRCACAVQNEIRMGKSRRDAHAQVNWRCACAGQKLMRMRRSNGYPRVGLSRLRSSTFEQPLAFCTTFVDFSNLEQLLAFGAAFEQLCIDISNSKNHRN